AFGDPTVILERAIDDPRHIEIQVFGDAFGNAVHLGERDCSVQRRHQKLIEEAPSPAVSAELRARMGAVAVAAIKSLGYEGAGTLEFLLDRNGEFYFMEMNTRLQVEHPVTEAVTGLDLVELQLRVAAGERLAISQVGVRLEGHAIEARVIAEDPLAGFLPSSGTIDEFVCPYFVRVDSWVQNGTVVSPYYDSLLAKVIAHGQTRAESITTLAQALQEIRIEGVHHNLDLLLATVESPEFRRGELHTGFLQEHHTVEALAEV